jgi:hypothetical protein
MLSYQKLLSEIYMASMTWMPELMVAAAESGYAKGCFNPGGASKIVAQAEERILKINKEAVERAANTGRQSTIVNF